MVEMPNKTDTKRVRLLLDKWYMEHAREVFSRSLATSLLGLRARLEEQPILHLRRMPKRWGSWTQRGAIYLRSGIS